MKKSSFLIVLAFAFSCNSAVPKDVLPPKKMQAVLWDVIQADEVAGSNLASDSGLGELQKHVNYYQQVFAIHKISKQDFTKSLNYYQDHPARLKPILDSLQQFAQKEQTPDTLAKKPQNTITRDTTKRKLPVRIRPQ